MRPEHVAIVKETTFGTWVTPDTALPVTEASIQSRREQIKASVSGSGRARWDAWPGAKPVNGNLNMPWWPLGVAQIFATFLTDTAATDVEGDGSVYDQGMLPDDTAGNDSLSIQQIYSGSLGLNILSAMVNSVSITAAVKETVDLSFAIEAKDEAVCTEDWDHDGSASPAMVSVPAYGLKSLRPFIFYDATIIAGGTASLDGTENKIEIASGTTYSKLRNLNISIALNLDSDGYGLTDDPTRQNMEPGERVTTVTFDIDWSDLSTTFYDAWRAGNQLALDAKFVGPVLAGSYYYEAHIVVPAIHFDDAVFPSITGDKSNRIQSVTGEAVEESTSGYDVGVWIRTTESSV